MSLHTKNTFRNWKHGGVVPSFLPDKGGGGLFMKKENRGEGGSNNFGGHPPARIIWGWGVMGRDFLEVLPDRDAIFFEIHKSRIAIFNHWQFRQTFFELLNTSIETKKTISDSIKIFKNKKYSCKKILKYRV